MKKNLQTIKSTHRGFTLLETLFAVIIFSFALVSLMTIAGKGVVATSSARDQLTAEFLAEEGIETVRNVRDSNYVNNITPWDTGFNQCLNGSSCDVDYTAPGKPTIIACGTGGCDGRILYNNLGVFRPDAGGTNPTTFWREITIENIGGGNGKQEVVKSTVHWKQKNINRSLTLTTYMADWQ